MGSVDGIVAAVQVVVSLPTEITKSLSFIGGKLTAPTKRYQTENWTSGWPPPSSQAKWLKWNEMAIVSYYQAQVSNACSLPAMHPTEALYILGLMLNWRLWKTDT